MSRHAWAVILAGGDGVRLRSLTRGITGDDRPKQFCRSLADISPALGTVGELPALERVYCALPSVDFSRQVLTARPDRLAVLPVRGVHWNDLGDPERVLATRRRAHAMRTEELLLVPISA
jgi:hypothetical protein